jgi:hypothetical protein
MSENNRNPNPYDPKGRCTACGGMFRVKNDGKLQRHTIRVDNGRLVCTGSDTRPRVILKLVVG